MTIAQPELPSIAPEAFARRLEQAGSRAADRGIDAVLVGVGADLRYLAGYNAMPLERLTMLVVPAAGRPTLLAPRLEAAPARGCPAATGGFVDVVAWEETEDPIAAVARLVADSVRHGGPLRPGDSVGPRGDDRPPAVAISDRLWAAFVLGLQRAMPEARFELASSVLRDLRITKDPEEVALLTAAAHAADRVVRAIAAGPLVERSEESVAREVRDRLVEEGHESADFAIVASGPNSASPHHEASARVIAAGEPIVLDIGGMLGGYGSDITRTLWVTGGDPGKRPPQEFLELYSVLQGAQSEASHAVRPGVAAEHVDAVAREIIANAGFGELFIHRTGHGIGLEVHEDPYIVAGNAEPLRAGMAFSVEPGIYLEGQWGARIEDIVVCGEDGPVVLNEVPRTLLVVDG